MKERSYESYWKKSRLKFAALATFGSPLFLLALLVPKDKNLWVYGSQNGYKISDNSYYHFQLLDQGIRKVFITKNRQELARRDLAPGCYVYSRTFRGFWLQLRASKAHYSHSIFDLDSPLICASTVVCFQHGFPIKLGGVADPRNNWLVKNPAKFLIRHIVPYTYVYYADEVWTPGGIFEENSKAVFSLTNPELIVRSPPRLGNVVLNQVKGKTLVALTYSETRTCRQKLLELGFLRGSKREFTLDLESDVSVHVRLHPLEEGQIAESELVHPAVLDRTPSIHESLGLYQLLITDFSSIGFDSLELGIRTIFWTRYLDEFASNEIGLFQNVVEEIEANGLDEPSQIWEAILEPDVSST